MQLGSKAGLDTMLPAARLARLAVDYANLKAPTPEAIAKLAAALWSIRDEHLEYHVIKPNARHAHSSSRTRWASMPEWHTYIRELMRCAAGNRRMTEGLATELGEFIDRWQPALDVYYDSKRGFDAIVLFPGDADLLWYVALGCAALVDSHGPYKGLVKPCANFAGAGPGSEACGAYVFRYSFGGRAPTEYCSAACRNRVNVRRLATKQRAQDKESLRIKAKSTKRP